MHFYFYFFYFVDYFVYLCRNLINNIDGDKCFDSNRKMVYWA